MISILKAALDAAMTTVPGLLMADWMTILEMANTALWMPAGRPIRKMRRRIVRSIRSCFGSRWMSMAVRRSCLYSSATIVPPNTDTRMEV